MNGMADVHFRADAELKNEFKQVVNGVGLSASSVLNALMAVVAREKKIPADLESELYTEDELEALAMLNDPNTKYYSDFDEMARDKGWI